MKREYRVSSQTITAWSIQFAEPEKFGLNVFLMGVVKSKRDSSEVRARSFFRRHAALVTFSQSSA